jgi:hypothetical protein
MFPEWVLKFREPKTEIRLIKGHYYKYQIRYEYNKEKKRTDKKTVKLLGKITEADGFIASDKDLIRQKATELPKVDIKTFGVYNLFSTLMSEEIASLTEHFKKDEIERLLSFSMMRWAYQAPIKRTANYHAHDFCSEVWSKERISDKHISDALKFFGQNRDAVVSWMREIQGTLVSGENKYVMMDSTHVSTVSERLTINAKGYNPSFDFDKQIRLMYLFSAELKRPVYYRLINGNITDIKSMTLCIKEMNVKDVIYIADKGFYSISNVTELDANQLKYIIPLRRNNKMIDVEPIRNLTYKKELKNHFIYQNRVIWFYQYEQNGQKLVTFIDEKLKVEEEADYLARIKTQPEKYTEEKYFEKIHGFGTFTLLYNLGKNNVSPQELYEAYKQRNEIETMFDAYKNFLNADSMYMQDRYVLEGWLFSNFLAMIAYYKLFSKLKQANLLSKYSPKDIIEMSKAIYKIKVQNIWHKSEITQKTQQIFKKIGIDYLI